MYIGLIYNLYYFIYLFLLGAKLGWDSRLDQSWITVWRIIITVLLFTDCKSVYSSWVAVRYVKRWLMHYVGQWHDVTLLRFPASYRLWCFFRAPTMFLYSNSVSDRFRYGFRAMCRITNRDETTPPNSIRYVDAGSRVFQPFHRDKPAAATLFQMLFLAYLSFKSLKKHHPYFYIFISVSILFTFYAPATPTAPRYPLATRPKFAKPVR